MINRVEIEHNLKDQRRYILHLFDEIDSTNIYMMNQGKEGEPEWSVAITDYQTAGRGRMYRRWESSRGKGLLFSILLRPQVSPEESNLINLLCAATLAEYLGGEISRKTGQAPDIRLKWPNDVLLNGKKVSGILLQSNLIGARLKFVVLGIGLNVNQTREDFSPQLQKTATSLKIVTQQEWKREKLLAGFLDHFYENYNALFPRNKKAILNRYLQKVIHLNEFVTVNQRGEKLSGIFSGLSPEGFMILKNDNHEQTVLNGEIISNDGSDQLFLF